MSALKPTKNRGLGKGFEALLPNNFDDSLLVDTSDRIRKVKIEAIEPNADQPRRHFDVEALEQLAASIKQHGVLQPLIVTSLKSGKYQIVAGERRWRAAQQAELAIVPVIVRSLEELEQLEIALVENVQRVDLSPLEQADSIERLHQQFSMTYESIAARLGKAVPTIHNIIRLLQLPDKAKQALRDKSITEGHARQILALKDFPDKQTELLQLIIKNGWSVRQAERYVTAFKASTPNAKSTEVRQRMRSETPETKQLGKQLKTSVTIRHTARGGKLEIGFSSAPELERLLQSLLQK